MKPNLHEKGVNQKFPIIDITLLIYGWNILPIYYL